MIKVTVFDVDDTMFSERFVRLGFHAVGDWIVNKYAVPKFLKELGSILYQETEAKFLIEL
ncbi:MULTISPECIES: hypothetical protein [unclassified Microcoleus]|uniref:hypothetical protein n=1 Tax=unclassified Microcoleus TaxID=2642155 RepID=UPI002FD013D5